MAKRDDEVRKSQIEAVRTAIVEAVGIVLAAGNKTQCEIAAITGLDQPRVSRLKAGVTNVVAADRALAVLTDLGYNVTILVEPSPSGKGHIRSEMCDR